MPLTLRSPAACLLLVVPALLAGAPARAQEPEADDAAPKPSFAGSWTLDHKRSDDATLRVNESAGSRYLSGAAGIGGITLFPRSSTRTEVERVELRQFLLDGLPALDAMVIEQTPAELKTVHGEDGVRIFYFGREAAGSNAAGGRLVRRIRWQGTQIVLESESEKTKVVEIMTLLPSGDQLIHALRMESDLFEKPLDLRLFYVRAKAGAARP